MAADAEAVAQVTPHLRHSLTHRPPEGCIFESICPMHFGSAVLGICRHADSEIRSRSLLMMHVSTETQEINKISCRRREPGPRQRQSILRRGRRTQGVSDQSSWLPWGTGRGQAWDCAETAALHPSRCACDAVTCLSTYILFQPFSLSTDGRSH